jgi:arylsulfatase A-like enzyme
VEQGHSGWRGPVGRFVDHRLEGEIHEKIGENLPAGSAGIIAVFREDQRLGIEQALGGATIRSLVQGDKAGMAAALKESLAEAMHKFEPDRTQLPIPDREFGGTAGHTFDESVADWSMIPGPKPPKGAPNVLICLIDDAGFGGPNTFGGAIQTPNLTRVREMGLTYNRFHVTAVCSPTRAALLTGRNHHRVGMGGVAEFPGPFPGYTGSRPRSCTALPRVLQENGYVTGGFGKWHLTPGRAMGAAGPFNNWPTSWGFDHFWGFLTGATGQYDPVITQDNKIIGVPEGKDGKLYYLPDDITDKSIEWLHAVRAQDQETPWFMYYSTGCSHAPHHVAKEWADRYKGKFDAGWDVYREQKLERQKKLGVVPPDTDLTERPELYPAWDSLSDAEKKLYARQMEVFAGYSENADWNVGRLLDELERMGELDDTLIFYIWGDNGASMEDTVTGSFNETTFFNAVVLEADQQLKIIEKFGGIEALGGFHTAPHFAAARAHANNTPFQWGKQMGSHLGGTRDPMVVAWPSRITPDRELRTQFTHCIDIAPTVLEAAGIPEPTVVDGIEQEPMDGTSFAYTLDDPGADERHTVQYFENYGSRAIYKDGRWASAKLDKVPWDLTPETLKRFEPGAYDPERDVGQLYYLPDDFSQANDLAAEHPDKLGELKELFWQEAKRNRVFPLLGGFAAFFGILPPMPSVTRVSFARDVQNIAVTLVPRIQGRSYAIEAHVTIPDGGAEGVLVANSDFIGGFALWIDEHGLLNHTYQFLGVETYKQTSTRPVPTGDVTLTMQFETDKPEPGSGGRVTLWANDEQIGEGTMPHTVAMIFTTYAGMDIGRDNGGVVDLAYEDKAPYAFTGTIEEVVFDVKPHAHEHEKKLHQAAHHAGVAAGIAG